MARDPQYIRIINSSAWRILRNVYISQHPLCEMCQRAGTVTAAQEVHHKIPIESGGTYAEKLRLAYSPSNLQSLCRPCHTEAHRVARKGTRAEREKRAKDEAEAFVNLFCTSKRPPGGNF